MFDYIVVVATDDLDAKWLVRTSLRADLIQNSIIVPVSESGWNGRAGNGLGTLFVIENASVAIGKDIIEEVKQGKSVLIVHTAGEGTRNILTRTVKNKALIEVSNLTILEGVIKQFQDFAIPSRIMVTWGDQLLLFADSQEDIQNCAEKTHVMLFGLQTELTAEIARNYGIQIVRSVKTEAEAKRDGCELLDFEDSRSYEVVKMKVKKEKGCANVLINTGLFTMSGIAAECLRHAFRDALDAREGKFNSDELWQSWVAPEYETNLWLRERADRVKAELSSLVPHPSSSSLRLISTYLLSDRTIWVDFGTNESYYNSIMRLLGDDKAARRLREFLDLSYNNLSVAFEAGVVRKSLIVNSTARYAELEEACVINSTLNRIKGKRSVIYNVVDDAALEVYDSIVVDVFHPIKGKIRLTMRIGAEKESKEKWWYSCLSGNEFALSEVAEMMKTVSADEKEDMKKRFETIAKCKIAKSKRLIEGNE